jgi:hypothetical protein
LAKIILKFIPYRLSNKLMIVCRGYNEDFKNFTELVWEDDKYLDFFDRRAYPQFQMWILAQIQMRLNY